MSKKDEVTQFLRDFKDKLEIFDVIFRERDKNLKTLTELEITRIQRKNYLKELKVNDYIDGPITEEAYGGSDMWVFGKEIKEREIYIKITMGRSSKPVLCISFHIAEYPLKYYLKK